MSTLVCFLSIGDLLNGDGFCFGLKRDGDGEPLELRLVTIYSGISNASATGSSSLGTASVNSMSSGSYALDMVIDS